MNYPDFRFIFQNAPGLHFTKWYQKFDESLKNKNYKNYLFCDHSIANSFFVRSILSHKTFVNIFFSDNVLQELQLIETHIKKHCEHILLKGMFSECKLEFDSDTHKNFVLRDYNRIDLFKMFNESWQFYSQNKPKLFYKLSDYYSFMPFSYIWSLFFTESNAEALVMDDFVVKNSHIFGKHMNINYQLEKDKKYKILYLDTMSKPVDVSFYMDKIEKNGLLLLKNLDIEGPNMVGWRDLRGRTIGLVKT
jgi:hypothetical protein